MTLGPGERQLVQFRLTPSDLAYFDAAHNQWTVAPGRYTVMIGRSSDMLGHTATFDIR